MSHLNEILIRRTVTTIPGVLGITANYTTPGTFSFTEALPHRTLAAGEYYVANKFDNATFRYVNRTVRDIASTQGISILLGLVDSNARTLFPVVAGAPIGWIAPADNIFVVDLGINVRLRASVWRWGNNGSDSRPTIVLTTFTITDDDGDALLANQVPNTSWRLTAGFQLSFPISPTTGDHQETTDVPIYTRRLDFQSVLLPERETDAGEIVQEAEYRERWRVRTGVVNIFQQLIDPLQILSDGTHGTAVKQVVSVNAGKDFDEIETNYIPTSDPAAVIVPIGGITLDQHIQALIDARVQEGTAARSSLQWDPSDMRWEAVSNVTEVYYLLTREGTYTALAAALDAALKDGNSSIPARNNTNVADAPTYSFNRGAGNNFFVDSDVIFRVRNVWLDGATAPYLWVLAPAWTGWAENWEFIGPSPDDTVIASTLMLNFLTLNGAWFDARVGQVSAIARTDIVNDKYGRFAMKYTAPPQADPVITQGTT